MTLAEMEAQIARLRAELPELDRDTAKVGDHYFSENLGGEMIVCQIGNANPSVGPVIPIVHATTDGGELIAQWHQGPESDEPTVYFEMIGPATHTHGWLDAKSRKVVQSG